MSLPSITIYVPGGARVAVANRLIQALATPGDILHEHRPWAARIIADLLDPGGQDVRGAIDALDGAVDRLSDRVDALSGGQS